MKINNNVALSVAHLSVKYQRATILDNICFTVDYGSCVGIIGPNGAGKSSLLKSIMDIIPRCAGEISFFGSTLCHERKRIAYVCQKSAVDWDFPITVFDVALMGCYVNIGWFKRPSQQDKQLAWDALDKVGMALYAHRPIGLLSGGQQQRVFLARALVQNADLYILDEPFAGVDMATEHIMVALFKQLCTAGKAVIIVHHDLQTLERYFDTLMVLNKTIIQYGAVKDVLNTDALCSAYGRPMNYYGYQPGAR